MDKNFKLEKIARFFDMPASTFRYWEDKGFYIPERKLKINIGNMQLKI